MFILATGEEKLPFGMLQEQEEEHLCALMSKWKRKGEDMRDRGCWQALNVLLLHIALLCSLRPPALCSVEMKQHVVKWLSHTLEPFKDDA